MSYKPNITSLRNLVARKGTGGGDTDLSAYATKANPTFTGVSKFADGSEAAPSITNPNYPTSGFYFGVTPESAAKKVGVTIEGNNYVSFHATTRAYDYPDADIDATSFLKVEGQLLDELTTKTGAIFRIHSLAADQDNNGAQVGVTFELLGVPPVLVGEDLVPVIGTAATYGATFVNKAKTNNVAFGIEASSGGGTTEESGSGTTPGEVIGGFFRAKDSDVVAVGSFSTSTGHSNPTPQCIGVVGYAKNATDYNVGGYFGLHPFVGSVFPIFPTITESCALIADNDDLPADIFQARDNGTVVFRIADEGIVTFTNTVNGITKDMVGLANVDNTSDAGKPVSTAQQTALDLKANLANPQFSGNVGVGVASAIALNIYGTNNPGTQMKIERQSSNATCAFFTFTKNRNVGGTPNPLLANDFLGQISFTGSDGTATASTSFPTSASIHAVAETTATAGNVPTSLVFSLSTVAALTLKNDRTAIFGGAIQMAEMTAPGAPAVNNAVIYLDDSGGKTRAMIRFATGAAVQLAIEP